LEEISVNRLAVAEGWEWKVLAVEEVVLEEISEDRLAVAEGLDWKVLAVGG